MTITVENPIKLEMTRHFDAPLERVFDAWLQKSWADWAGPPGVQGEVTLMEPHAGGRYRIVMHTPNGGTLTVGGIYREVTRPSSAGPSSAVMARIVMSWKWEHEDADTMITLTFREKNGGTDLTLRHEGFAAAERRDSHNMGWTGTLDKLAIYLKTPSDPAIAT